MDTESDKDRPSRPMPTTKKQDTTFYSLAYRTPPYDNPQKLHSEVLQHHVPEKVVLLHVAKRLSQFTSVWNSQKINNNTKNLHAFLLSVMERAKCDKVVLLLALKYFAKIYSIQEDQSLPEFAHCAKRIYLCCVIIAHKFLNDSTFSMESWKTISGLSKKNLTLMERWCLNTLQYKLDYELDYEMEVRLLENSQQTVITPEKRILDQQSSIFKRKYIQ